MPILKFNSLWRRVYSSSSSATESSTNYINRHVTYLLSKQTINLKSLLKYHSYIITTGHKNNIFIASKLISLYASIKEPNFSAKVFDSIQFKDTFVWNSMIKAHFSNGNYSLALEYYLKMRSFDVLPNNFTIPMVVSASAEIISIYHGKMLHGLTSKLGIFEGNCAVGSSFVYMYSMCGCMEDASRLFDEMSMRDVVAWTALIIGYIRNDECEKGLERICEMHRVCEEDERPNSRTLDGGFQACGNLGDIIEGKCLHGLVVKTGIGCTQAVQSSILSMYSKCGSPEEAYLSFYELANRDLISWTCIIGVYARIGDSTSCLWLFRKMLFAGVSPDEILVACVLSSFVGSAKISVGKAFHAIILRENYLIGQLVNNALLSMYFRFGLTALAAKVFRLVTDKDNEFWCIMISGYGKAGMQSKCLELFKEMQYVGIKSSSNCLISAISSCSRLGAINLGRSLHCYAVKSLKLHNTSIANSLIDMYAKNGSPITAQKIFSTTVKDTVSWNILISSYAHSGHFGEALTLFDDMILEGYKPNEATLVSVLSASSQLASLEKGEQIHNYVKERGYECKLSIATALVDMYSKCGKLNDAKNIFELIKNKDVVSWNVMISGFGMHGDAKSAIEMFREMEQSNVRPNELTFLAVLSACNHVGLVEEGKYMFKKMREYCFTPTLKHYSCMVDLLARSGNLHEAELLVLSMPVAPDGGLLGALLSACKVHGDIELGVRIAKLAIESDPENDGYYVILSDLYTCLGRWEEAEKVRVMMKQVGVRKIAGWSSI